MMKILLKKLFRDIRTNIAQFITIILIVSIGSFLFVGLSSVASSLRDYTKNYYHDYHLSDATVNFISLTSKKIDAIKDKYTNIQEAEGRVNFEGKQTFKNYSSALTISSFSPTSKLNRSYIVQGRKKLNNNEILLDSDYIKAHHYKMNDSIQIQINSKKFTFKIAGIIENPEFVMKVSGNNLTPEPQKFGIGYITEQKAFDISKKNHSYNQLLLKIKGNNSKKVLQKLSEDYDTTYISGLVTTESSNYTNLKSLITTDESLSRVIPILFFIVAAVITFISMTRLIQQNRVQTGIMRSLGKRIRYIRSYYLFYTLLTSSIGTFIGSVLAYFAFTDIGEAQVSSLYALPNYHVKIELQSLIPSFCLVLLFGLLAIYFSTRKVLKERPANLIRQEPPKNIKGILLERIPFLWRYLSYGSKYVIRNIFLNKIRFCLNLLGVALSFLMIILAFGYYNAMTTVVNTEINDVNTYNISIISPKINSIQDKLSNNPHLKFEKLDIQKLELGQGNNSIATTLYASSQKEHFMKVYKKNGQELSHYSNGIVIPKVYANKLHLKIGDKVRLALSNTQQSPIKVRVTAISTQYSSKFIVADADYLKEQGVTLHPSMLLIQKGKNSNEKTSQLIQSAKVIDKDLTYTTKKDVRSNMNAILSTTFPMVVLFLICAMSLTVATIYNISSINIFDRTRDIATLKVLGYSKNKVNNLIFKENIIISCVAMGFALPVGHSLFILFINAMTTELQAMPNELPYWCFALAIVCVLGITILSNLLLHRKVKAIDMIEGLKSVE
ncbi:permease [Streptococcus mutans ATCC 25175]|nr:permease [Streptococcus mutans 11SSST2]EMB82147.1 permease [Streptococcus mutans NVAB]EMP63530.1 permease [Streptococcus mutans ATCC 25175]QFG41357.1 ftsX-like permease family protein [Streptococcus mutans]EMP63541.1 permease [Streptococcus mutans ATCC 25175]